MKNLNSKGQSLVLFVVLIPFIIAIMAFVVNYGYLIYNTNKLNSLNKMLIDYGIRNIDSKTEEEIVNLIRINDESINNYEINIDEKEKVIKISLDKDISFFYYKYLNKDKDTIKSSYKGYLKDGKIIIERGN